MATGVHDHVHVIGFLIWLRLGFAVKFVASFFGVRAIRGGRAEEMKQTSSARE